MNTAYLDHPLGEGNGQLTINRHDNVANACSWFDFVFRTTRWAITAPWFAYVMASDDPALRPRAHVAQRILLERQDILIQCGGEISPHMRLNRELALRSGISVVDLTAYGRHVPTDRTDRRALELLLLNTRRATPRRVWLPPIERATIESMKAVRAHLSLIEGGRRAGSSFAPTMELFDTILGADAEITHPAAPPHTDTDPEDPDA